MSAKSFLFLLAIVSPVFMTPEVKSLLEAQPFFQRPDIGFSHWKLHFNKRFQDRKEEQIRANIFSQQQQGVINYKRNNPAFDHNTYFLNQDSTLTLSEFQRRRVGTIMGAQNVQKEISIAKKPINSKKTSTPQPYENFDWRVRGIVTPVKDQGDTCQASWAFAAVAAIESRVLLSSKQFTAQSLDLSEQELLDCSRKFGNIGCNGGSILDAFKYVHSNGGLLSEDKYPYKKRSDLGCFTAKLTNSSKIGKLDVQTPYYGQSVISEQAILDELVNHGPVVALMSVASPFRNMDLKSGIYRDKFLCDPSKPNHAVVIVGYGATCDSALGDCTISAGANEQQGKQWTKYWIVKSSWGDGWADGGFGKIIRGQNLCGIENYVTWPIMENSRA